jgi:hypothetical protein
LLGGVTVWYLRQQGPVLRSRRAPDEAVAERLERIERLLTKHDEQDRR